MSIYKLKSFGIGARWGSLWAIFLTWILSSLAHADTNVSASQPLGDWISQVFALGQNWKSMGLWAGISVALKLLIDATKTDVLSGFFNKLSDSGQILLIVTVSALSVGIAAIAHGASLIQVVSAVIQSSAGAMFFHEVLNLIQKKPLDSLPADFSPSQQQAPSQGSSP